MSSLNIILNGKNITGNTGESILELAKRNGIEIPTLCNDPRIEPYSSCYVCVVEVEGMRGMQPSCSTKITEGMKITTNSDKVVKARKSALDLLVSNHYADCTAPCKQTCPAGVDVQGYISLIEKGLFSEAVELIKKVNPLPAICGRICVRPCEVACRRNLLDEGAAVGIDYLKRFASDIDLESPNRYIPEIKPSTGKKVAIIGAGPGGLSAAWFLQLQGHSCDIFEANPKSGGWLRYGIPEYRLPNEIIDKEVAAITELGANIYYNKNLGDNFSYKEIKEKYQATILTIGSQGGTPIGCEGDDAENVFSGIEFLRNMEITGQQYNFKGKTIAVIGGGNTAMDCCRTSLRCNADKVYVIYRRTEKEMPANPIEIHESKLEGVEYLFLTAPKKVNKTNDGKVKSITCLKMELGEPDASGRRRPVVVENSDFEVEIDYILAAIGQKTIVNFINDINEFATDGQLKINKWGDLDANSKTLQTGINSVFAAGDGVTGPATVIEAIAQARKAARSCDQYLKGQELTPENYEFISKKDNFKKQQKDNYKGHFAKQLRHEMPTMDSTDRINFKEVELGYENEQVAHEEANRCLECGCVEYYDCDLKKYATDYNATQEKYKGSFKDYEVKFDHPFIEIDNNKCILCARCVRICREVVGANALGLINRGFDTYVAPSMQKRLGDTNCESCGMCISTCPTAAISENALFKPGPVQTTSIQSICNYCSVGCEIEYHQKGDFVWKVTGSNGMINKDGNLCRFPKFGYNSINNKTRITKPLLKENGTFKEISFEEAYNIITNNANSIKAEETAVFAGARLSNEEIFLVKKFANEGLKTQNIGSFHYLGRGNGYAINSLATTPFEQISGAEKVFLFGSEINTDNAVVGFMIQNKKFLSKIKVESITTKQHSSMEYKIDKTLHIVSYYHFIKAANHYLLTESKQNNLFISAQTNGFEDFKKTALAENFDELALKSGVSASIIKAFADDYNMTANAILVFSEKEISANTSVEIRNFAMITGKLGKTSMGIISLKEKNNSEGILNFEAASLTNDILEKLNSGKIKNLFIFGEDPIGCSVDKTSTNKWFNNTNFIVVQDYFMTETAKQATLILPASFQFETGGSYTNTQKVIQQFGGTYSNQIIECNLTQMLELAKRLNISDVQCGEDVNTEMLKAIAKTNNTSSFEFQHTSTDNQNRLFDYGCDNLVLKFENYFENSFTVNN
jgi:formate dehydrogenase major subunit